MFKLSATVRKQTSWKHEKSWREKNYRPHIMEWKFDLLLLDIKGKLIRTIPGFTSVRHLACTLMHTAKLSYKGESLN